MPSLGGVEEVRHYRILFVVAVGLLFMGFALLDRGFDFRSTARGAEAFSIPGGPQWFYVVELELDQGGQVFIDYRVANDGVLSVYLFEPENYGEYYASGTASAMVGSATGNAGSLAAQVPAEGTYYLVFAHGPGYEFTPQEIEIAYQFTGLQPDDPVWGFAVAGLASVVAGLATATLAALGRLRFLSNATEGHPRPA